MDHLGHAAATPAEAATAKILAFILTSSIRFLLANSQNLNLNEGGRTRPFEVEGRRVSNKLKAGLLCEEGIGRLRKAVKKVY